MKNELEIKMQDEWVELNAENGILGLYVDMDIKKITIEGFRGTIIDYFISKAYDINPDKDVIYKFRINGNILQVHLSDLRTKQSTFAYDEESDEYEEIFYCVPNTTIIVLTII